VRGIKPVKHVWLGSIKPVFIRDTGVLLISEYDSIMHSMPCFFNPGFAVVVEARCRKPKRNVQLERFCSEGISIDMLRSKIVKKPLQQRFESTHVLSGRLM
jgi:hypothetical protein